MASGVYQIRCVKTGDGYIGTAKDLLQRKRRNFNALTAGKHHNPRLQAGYDAHGADAFVFEVLEFNEAGQKMMVEERRWMERLRPSLNIDVPYEQWDHARRLAASRTHLAKSGRR